MKEIIPSIKAEMDGNGIKKAIEKINITNNCFFTMINKIDQLVETLAKKKKKKRREMDYPYWVWERF